MRRQFPIFDKWTKKELTKTALKTWTGPIPDHDDLDNYMFLDRLIFVHDQTAFVAGSWKDDEYTWINVKNGEVFEPEIEGSWDDEVRVLIPYTYEGDQQLEEGNREDEMEEDEDEE